jgi:hypothetical protein
MALIVSKGAQKKSVLFKSSFGRDLFSLIPCEISNLPFDPAVSQIKGVKVSQTRDLYAVFFLESLAKIPVYMMPTDVFLC